MKLTELNPRWMAHGGEGVTKDGQQVPRREGVGISLDCPCGCAYRLAVTFSNPIDGQGQLEDAGVAWERTGDTFETLSLTPSIQREFPCNRWHGFITNGEVRPA
jgi:hypothetical protein